MGTGLVSHHVSQSRSTQPAVFLPTFSADYSKRAKRLGALPLDLGRRAGVVEGDDRGQRGTELLAGAGVVAVHGVRVTAPAAGDLADRQAVVEPQPQQLDPTAGRLAGPLGVLGLPPRRLGKQAPGPGAVEGEREPRLVAGDLPGVEPVGRRLLLRLARADSARRATIRTTP